MHYYRGIMQIRFVDLLNTIEVDMKYVNTNQIQLHEKLLLLFENFQQIKLIQIVLIHWKIYAYKTFTKKPVSIYICNWHIKNHINAIHFDLKKIIDRRINATLLIDT